MKFFQSGYERKGPESCKFAVTYRLNHLSSFINKYEGIYKTVLCFEITFLLANRIQVLSLVKAPYFIARNVEYKNATEIVFFI